MEHQNVGMKSHLPFPIKSSYSQNHLQNFSQHYVLGSQSNVKYVRFFFLNAPKLYGEPSAMNLYDTLKCS